MIVVAICALGGLSWFVSALFETFQHILPSGGSYNSTSLQPFELSMHTRAKGRELIPSDATPLEWKLVVPRAFVTYIIGDMGDSDHAGDGKGGNLFTAYLDAVISDNSLEISPAIFARPEDLFNRYVDIHLFNLPSDPLIMAHDSCITDDNYKTVLESRGAKNVHDRRCSDQFKRCSIYTHADGWDVKITVSRQIYADPDRICNAVLTFLNKHTVHRDDIR